MLPRQHDQLAISFSLGDNCRCVLPACHDYQAKLHYPADFEPTDTNLYTCTGSNMDCLLQTPAVAFQVCIIALFNSGSSDESSETLLRASSPYLKSSLGLSMV